MLSFYCRVTGRQKLPINFITFQPGTSVCNSSGAACIASRTASILQAFLSSAISWMRFCRCDSFKYLAAANASWSSSAFANSSVKVCGDNKRRNNFTSEQPDSPQGQRDDTDVSGLRKLLFVIPSFRGSSQIWKGSVRNESKVSIK